MRRVRFRSVSAYKEVLRMKASITGLDLLQVAFIVLKLCGVISWPWVLVLAPIWITTILVVVLIVVKIVGDRR